MRKLLAVLVTVLMLVGCSEEGTGINRSMELRNQLLKGNGCTFQTTVTADYGDSLYTFDMDCNVDTQGALSFTVVKPDSVAGITGTVSQEGGKLTFSDKALAFSPLADGLLTPVSAPWVFLKALRGGYINSCSQEGEYCRLSVDDSYDENALRLDVWLDGEMCPVRAEILWKNRRVLSLDILDFRIL